MTVLPLNEIKIEAPLRQLEVGSVMPLHAFLSKTLTPPFYADAQPSLFFEWSTSNSQLVQLRSPYYKVNKLIFIYILF